MYFVFGIVCLSLKSLLFYHKSDAYQKDLSFVCLNYYFFSPWDIVCIVFVSWGINYLHFSVLILSCTFFCYCLLLVVSIFSLVFSFRMKMEKEKRSTFILLTTEAKIFVLLVRTTGIGIWIIIFALLQTSQSNILAVYYNQSISSFELYVENGLNVNYVNQ